MTRGAKETFDDAQCGHVLERPPIVLTVSDRIILVALHLIS